MDQQGEIVDYPASKEAFAEWTEFMSSSTQGRSMGNIREMHQPNPVGKLIAYKPDDAHKKIWVGVKLSTSEEGENAWTKVNDGTLNGFSIGAPWAEREMRLTPKGDKPEVHVTKYKLAELSLVDNPACPDAFITEVKLAKRFDEKDASYAGEIIKRFTPGEEPEPRGDDVQPKAAAASVGELRENAFVDASGAVWKRVGGRVVRDEILRKTEEEPMTIEKDAVEKRTNIGPVQKPKSGPPGPDKPALATAPNPGNKKPGTSDDYPETAKDADADSTNTGRAGGNHAPASKPQSVPKGQGKDAEAGEIPPPGVGKGADAAMDKPPGVGKDAEADADAGMKDADAATTKEDAADADAARKSVAVLEYKFCGICGQGLSKAYGSPMNHAACIEKQQVGTPMDQLTKAFTAAVQPLQKQVNDMFTAVNERIAKLEKSPTSGGPMRTELPNGVRAVDKGTSEGGSGDGDVAKAFDHAASLTKDPFLKDALSRESARALIKMAQAGAGPRQL